MPPDEILMAMIKFYALFHNTYVIGVCISDVYQKTSQFKINCSVILTSTFISNALQKDPVSNAVQIHVVISYYG